MKREDLKSWGVADDIIDKIMAQNGRDIESAKGEAESVRLSASKKDEEITALKQAVSEWETKYNKSAKEAADQLARQKTAYEREKATDEFFKGVEFSSALARESAVSRFNQKAFELKDGKFDGADDWLKALRKEAPEAFKAQQPQNKPSFTNPINPAAGQQQDLDPFAFRFQHVRENK